MMSVLRGVVAKGMSAAAATRPRAVKWTSRREGPAALANIRDVPVIVLSDPAAFGSSRTSVGGWAPGGTYCKIARRNHVASF